MNNQPRKLIIKKRATKPNFKETEQAPIKIELNTELPISQHEKEIHELIKKNKTSIIVGETGSGKTTQIPLMLWETLGKDCKVAITQPRRTAARRIANYVAEKSNTSIGQEVGYQVRFENETTEGTNLNFMTDGILLRKLQNDPLLQEYEAVMIDEAHERSINIDFCLGLLKRAQQLRKEKKLKPLKIIVTSATLEHEKFVDYFDQAPMLEVPGRLFPLDINYVGQGDYSRKFLENLKENIKHLVEQVYSKKRKGNILVFLHGQQEINYCLREIENLNLPNAECLPLYASLSPQEQDKIFKDTGKRKIIFSTNIAETSLTVPGVNVVIDSGIIKQKDVDPVTGIEALITTENSKSSARQRAGRAGRLEAGDVYRLYDEKEFKKREEHQKPEIRRSNLANIILTMSAIGIKDFKNFDFIDKPKPQLIDKAVKTLKILGALDENNELTETGKLMAELPVNPEIGRMVVEAIKYKCEETICTIAAFLGLKSVFFSSRDKKKQAEANLAQAKFKNQRSDFLTYLKIYQEWEKNNYNKAWCFNNFLNHKTLIEVQEVRQQLFTILKKNGIRAQENLDETIINRCIASGLLENFFIHQEYHSYQNYLSAESDFYIFPGSGTFGAYTDPKFIFTGTILETSKKFMRDNAVIGTSELFNIAPQWCEKKSTLKYSHLNDKVTLLSEIILKNHGTINNIEEDPTTEEKTEYFLKNVLPTLSHLEFNQTIAETKRKYENFWKREPKLPAFSKVVNIGNLYYEYLKDLQIHSLKQIEELSSEIKQGLNLYLDDILDPQIQEKILAKYPDQITINNKNFTLEYIRYEGYSKRTINLKVPAKEILKLKEKPRINKEDISIACLIKGSTKRFEQDLTLAEIKEKVAKIIEVKLLEEFTTNPPTELLEYQKTVQKLKITDKIPTGLKKFQYGLAPLTQKPLWAYPAIEAYTEYYGSNKLKFRLKVHKTKEEAKQIEKTTKDLVKLKKVQQKNLSEAEKQLQNYKELLEEVEEKFKKIYYNRQNTISSQKSIELDQEIREIKRKKGYALETAYKELINLNKRLDNLINQEKAYKNSKKAIDNYIKKNFSTCPLCNTQLLENYCPNYKNHQLSKINFQNQEQITLKELQTKKEKVIARIICDQYGEVFVKEEPSSNWWSGQEINALEEVTFNFKLTEEQAEKNKQLAELKEKEDELNEFKAYYEDDLSYAQSQVREGFWQRGKFKRGKHPHTNEDQWEIQTKGATYILNYTSQKPTHQLKTYFFEVINPPIVNTSNFKLYSVEIKPPLPEDLEYVQDLESEIIKMKEKLGIKSRKEKRKKKKKSNSTDKPKNDEFNSALDLLKNKFNQ